MGENVIEKCLRRSTNRCQSRNWKTILIMLKITTKQQKVDIKRRFCQNLNNNFSAQTKESKLLQSLKNQTSSLKTEITFLREELKEGRIT